MSLMLAAEGEEPRFMRVLIELAILSMRLTKFL